MKKKTTIRVMLPELRFRNNRMTQTELAQSAGLTQRTISRLETGGTNGIDFETLGNLCGALQCKPGDILEYAPDEAKQQDNGPAPAATASPAKAGKRAGK